jgi:streptogramin lyase
MPYHWKLTDDDGLPNLEIYDLHQDAKGYIWIATDGGLCRYDGKEIITYKTNLSKKTSAAGICESSDGTIWYQNFSGQVFFIDSSDQVQLFQLPDTIKLNSYFRYAVTAKQLKFASSSFFYDYTFATKEWHFDTLQSCYKHGTIRGFYSYDFKNDIFVDCFFNLLLKKDGVNINKGSLSSQSFLVQNAISLAGDSVLLLGYNKIYIDHIDQVSRLDPQALVLDQKGLHIVHPINDNQIWVTSTKGITLLEKNIKTNRWAVKQKVLEQESIGAFLKDREGNLWLGTLGNGVYVIPSLNISYYNSQNSPLNNSKINCLEVTADNNLLIGAAKGRVAILNPRTQKLKQFASLGERPVIALLHDQKRNQVFANLKDRYTIDLDKETTTFTYAPFQKHNALYKEDILITGGLIALRAFSLINSPASTISHSNVFNNQFEYYTTQIENAPTPLCYVTIKTKRTTALWADQTDPNSFWAGVDDSLFLYRDFIPSPILAPNGQAILPSDIHQSKDSTIWVSTKNQGIYGIKHERVIYHFTVADGLLSNNCKQLTTHEGNIWIGTDKGISQVNPKSKQIKNFNQLDGLLINNIEDIKIVNQKVWAATNKGLISFDVNTPSINSNPPLISITKWEVNDSSYALDKSNSFPFNQNNIKFTFQALALKSRNNYTYEYRLLGLDSLWIQQASSTNFVRFNLNPGTYTFEVRVRNEDGILSKQSPKVLFHIEPPYWETWWFRSLIGLVFLAIITLLIRLRYQFTQKSQATKNLITQLKMQALQSQMNPHFIFNAMSTIQSFWMYKDAKTALIYHAKFAKLMRLIFNYSDEKCIPIKEEIEFLKLYIDLEKIRLKYTINTIFEIDPIIEEEGLYIAPLLIQPIVENSFKHGFLHKEADGQLLIKLQKEGSYIKCLVEDDGVGRAVAKSYNIWQDTTTNKKSSSFVTQGRLRMLNQMEGQSPKKITYRISDLKDAQNNSLGTRTELWIPIINNF